MEPQASTSPRPSSRSRVFAWVALALLGAAVGVALVRAFTPIVKVSDLQGVKRR